MDVFLVDDHELIRLGFRALIDAEPDLRVVGEAATAEQALPLIFHSPPDVAVLDLQLPGKSGIDLCKEVTAAQPAVRCLVLSAFLDSGRIVSAREAGAAGYLLKRQANRDLVMAIRTVGGGGTLPEPTTAPVREGQHADDLELDPRLAKLSDQEYRILRLIAEGRTNRNIAARMFLAEKTVRNYVSNLLAKLEMHRRSEAAAYAARLEERGVLSASYQSAGFNPEPPGRAAAAER